MLTKGEDIGWSLVKRKNQAKTSTGIMMPNEIAVKGNPKIPNTAPFVSS